MELLDKVLGMLHAGGGYPGIFRVGIPLPLDQVLGASSVRGRSHVKDGFDLVVLVFTFYNIGGWSCIVGSMLRCFLVGC
jgi:hypothetical protein